MNRTRALFVLSVMIMALGALSVIPGGYSFYAGQTFDVTINAPKPSMPGLHHNTPTPSAPTNHQPCGGKPGPIVYYANDPLAAQYNDFGRPIDPYLNPLNESYNPKPDAGMAVAVSRNRLCHDPVLTRSIAIAAFPSWDGLHGHFDWMATLEKLYTLHWNTAKMVYYKTPPTPWTMSMHSNKTTRGPPTVHIVTTRYAGWYLSIPKDSGDTLLLRTGCGDQPALKQRTGYQAVLDGKFPTT